MTPDEGTMTMTSDLARPAQARRNDDQGQRDSQRAAAALVPLLSDYLDDLSRQTETRLGPVAGVAVTMRLDHEPWTVGASSRLAADVDQIQFDIGTGPCLLALNEGVLTYAPDLAADDRWGEYGPRAAARGAACCISVPVFVDDRPAAVLKVYSGEVDGLSEHQRAVARTVGLEVAGGVRLAVNLSAQAQLLDDREAAMHTRRAIDLALGVLMERTQSSAGEAFAMLRTLSQHRNVKLREAARQVLASVAGATTDDSWAPFRPRDGWAPTSSRTSRH